MNMEEIMKLEGRELDRMVAEKVMGWMLGKPEWCHGPMMHGGSFLRFWLDKDGRHARNGATIFSEQWSPSSDISAAWQVVEKMTNSGYYCELDIWSDEKVCMFTAKDCKMTVGDGGVVDIDGCCNATAETAPLAICRAALMAVEGN